MTAITDPIATLNTLLDTDPGLKTALHEASDLGQFAQIATACAQRHGTPLDAGELRTQIEVLVQQAAAASHPPLAELTDQQMEGVVGAGEKETERAERIILEFRRSKVG